MDEFASSILDAVDEAAIPEPDDREHDTQQTPPNTDSSARGARRLRNGIRRAATLQDKLLEKLLSQVIPADDGPSQAPSLASADDLPAYLERPGFSVALMSTNFRRFNARIGVVFKFQARLLRVLSWRRPTHTLSFLAVYTFVCLDPYLLLVLPLAVALFGVLVPSFVARHPAPAASDSDRVRNLGYSPRGPPLAPARTVRPAKELSRDFFRNMGDLQNVMGDFSVAHDKVVALVVPATNFSDEALSSALFVLLFAACAVMLIAAHLLPLRPLALLAGWAAVWSGHPAVACWISRAKRQYAERKSSAAATATEAAGATSRPALQAFVHTDILLDDAPETREVEIFELQRRQDDGGGGDDDHAEWEPWLFSPSPYDPLSAARLAGERPRGARFFEDVLPPRGWEWSEKKWALDLWSREWVEERIITGVEVETEGERWVYDMWSGGGDEREAGDGLQPSPVVGEGAGGGGDGGQEQGRSSGRVPGLSWEEGEEGIGRRGQWRRRRWVRTVKRKQVASADA